MYSNKIQKASKLILKFYWMKIKTLYGLELLNGVIILIYFKYIKVFKNN